MTSAPWRYGWAAAAGAAAVAWLGPPGTDLAAHVYQRALFLQHGFELWNNYWYAGRYTFVGYSLVYYPLAALVGIKVLAVLTAGVAAAAFDVIVRREWPEVGWWPSRAFAFVAAVSVLTAAFPYALGLMFALLAIAFLRPAGPAAKAGFAASAALTFAASPLAFVILLIVLVSIGSTRRLRLVPLLAVGAVGAAAAVTLRLFPVGGRFPFSFVEYVALLAFCIGGLALTIGVPKARVLSRFFIVYGLAASASFAVPSAVGENIARLRFVALPVFLVALSLRRWRPLFPALAAAMLVACWNLTPLASSFDRGVDDPSSASSFWTGTDRYLARHLQPSFRVEAVDTTGHWEAVYLPQARIPIVRGWFRQADFPQDALLYGSFGPRSYLHWLRSMGVSFVVLPRAPLDYSAIAEGALIRSGRSGLRPVFRDHDATVYAVPHPTGIVTGHPGARVLSMSLSALEVDLPHAGSYRIAIRYAPYWTATRGCVTPTADGMISLRVRHGGAVRLRFAVTPERLLTTGLGQTRACGGGGFETG